MCHIAETEHDQQRWEITERIKNAYNAALGDGCKTRDLGGTLSTDQFADAVIERLAD